MINKPREQIKNKNKIEVFVGNPPQSYYTYTKISKDNRNREIVNSVGSLTSIYRYRPINKHTIKQLENNDVFGSKAQTFNDPYDCRVKLDQNRCYQLVKQINPKISFAEIIKKISEFSKFIRNQFHVSCFSETNTNPMMWSHYAEKAKGFLIEYSHIKMLDEIIDVVDVSQVKSIEKDKSNKKPFANINLVFYTNHTIDLSMIFYKWYKNNFHLDLVNNLKDLNNIVNQVFYCKNEDWEYEREWRVIKMTLGNESFESICKVQPQAIYLGEFITTKNKKKLIAIAKKLELEAYQMYSDIEESQHIIKFKQIDLKK